jgi:hypothetical protein
VSSPNLSGNAKTFLDVWKQCGPFVAGTLFGASLTWSQHWLASSERKKRTKIEAEREGELLKQLDIKDKRIDKLHEQVQNLLSEREKATKPQKAKPK